MNVVRLHLEEADRLTTQPQLRELPDQELLRIQQGIDQWVRLATGYVMQKHKCPLPAALRVISEVQAELKAVVPVEEVRAVPLSAVLNLPLSWQGAE
jgi:hypothetical protein